MSSIGELALRIATVQALRGATYAADRVHDEPIDPLDLAESSTGALLAVYTSQRESRPDGTQQIELIVQIYLPMTVSIGGVEFQSRTAGGKALINIIERQIDRVLTVDQTPWAMFRRSLELSVVETQAQSFTIFARGSDKPSTYIGAHEVRYTLTTVAGPRFGPPVEIWAEFMALIAATPALAGMTPVIDAAIRSPEGLPNWRSDQAMMQISEATAYALGFTPADGTPSLGPVLPVEIIEDSGNFTVTGTPAEEGA